jgi:hypothetical protein
LLKVNEVMILAGLGFHQKAAKFLMDETRHVHQSKAMNKIRKIVLNSSRALKERNISSLRKLDSNNRSYDF